MYGLDMESRRPKWEVIAVLLAVGAFAVIVAFSTLSKPGLPVLCTNAGFQQPEHCGGNRTPLPQYTQWRSPGT